MERGLAASRTKAQALILAGQIKVNDVVVTKVGATIPLETAITLMSGPKYVSRGGDKLEGALNDFSLSPEGQVCLDVGASTGGFTDCMLQRGARKVYAVDVGTHQLNDLLRADQRVVSIEQKHILDIDRTIFQEPPTFVTIDVSFISLTKVLPHVATLLPAGARVVALLKPQFEVGAKNLRKGVVKSDEVRDASVQTMKDFVQSAGFVYHGHAPSHLMGPKGNQEYFFNLTKEGKN